MRVSLIVPVLNELKGMKIIMPQIRPEWCDQIIILDGHSTDGTLEWCKEQGYEVYTQKEKGMWKGCKGLFESGMVTGDIVITFSPDGNSVPLFIPQLIRKMGEGYDMVIASRYLDGAISLDDTRFTRFGNWLFTRLVNVRSKYKYTDALVIYRAYRTDIIKQLGFTNKLSWLQRKLANMSNLYGWESSMAVRAGKIPMKIAEIPASEPKAFRERRQNTLLHGFVIMTQIVHEGWLR